MQVFYNRIDPPFSGFNHSLFPCETYFNRILNMKPTQEMSRFCSLFDNNTLINVPDKRHGYK